MRRYRAFTLIELIVALAIVALLAAIAIPVYSAVQKQANNKAYQAQANTLAQAVSSFYAVNGCYPSWTGANTMPTGMTAYVGGVWPTGYQYLSLDQNMNGTGSKASAYYVGVQATVAGTAPASLATVWVVPSGTVWGVAPPTNTTAYPTC